MPGASGRLFANIVYKLANNEAAPIVLTKYNSAHSTIHKWDMQYIDNIKNIYTTQNSKPVFFTHLFPNWNTEMIGTIFINIKRENLTEICLNAVIKNVIDKIEFMNSGGILSDHQQNFMKTYAKFLPNNYIDILSDDTKLKKFFNSIKISLVPKIESYYNYFIDNQMTDTNIFSIEYDNMFDQINGEYTILNRLATWMDVKYNEEIHHIVKEYDINKFNIFKTYYPDFLQQ